jgi:glycosyltransferase involved in cell wall biosynthesis
VAPAEPALPSPVRVSVVSVTRNDLSGIQRTRASVLEQAGLHEATIQHIVVDGASTDGTLEWLEGQDFAGDSGFTSAPDAGIYDAMNSGARRAQGELLVFLNGGDRFARTTTVAEVIADYCEHHWEWAYGVAVLEAPDGSVSRIHQMAPFSRVRLGLGLAAVPHQATWMRTDFFHRIGDFDLAAGLSADMDHCWRAGALAEPRVLPDVLAIAEEGGTSARQAPGFYARSMRKNIRRHQESVLGNRALDTVASAGVTALTATVQVVPRMWDRLSTRGN